MGRQMAVKWVMILVSNNQNVTNKKKASISTTA